MEIYLEYGTITNPNGEVFRVSLKVTEDGYWLYFKGDDGSTKAQAVGSSTPICLAISRHLP